MPEKEDDARIETATKPADKPGGGPLARLDRAAGDAGEKAAEVMKKLALGPGIQTLWAAVLPMVGVRASRAGEFAGYFQIEPGPEPDEALVHIDIPHEAYSDEDKPAMGRVVSLSVRLAHDFRRLGDRYYCIDCELPADETRH